MATIPTQDPVASESPRDLKFNAGKIDEFATSMALQYLDRFGNSHYTIEGLKQLVLGQIYSLGWNLKGSFQAGGTVMNPGDLLQDTSTGIWYRWDDLSSLPKTVPAGSTPASSGGTGDGKWQPVDVADVLRKDLAKTSGAGLSGYDYAVSYAAGTVGSELSKRRNNIVYATADAGIPNDGSDVSAQVSTFLNANKGKFIVFDSGTYQFANVVLSGSGWEGTTIYFKGKHLMKPCTSMTEATPWPGFLAFTGILLTKEVNQVTLYYNGDGNRSAQIERQHIFNVTIWGATNINIPVFDVVEIMGDGLYINSSDQNSATAQNATNIYIGHVNGKNSVVSGRNLVSVISCIRGGINSLVSENIGGVINGERQPGGLDLEPNDVPGCVIIDFTVNNITVVGAGNIQMVGPVAASPKKIRNCHIHNATLRSSDQSIKMYGCTYSSIKGTVTTVAQTAGVIEGCDNCDFDIKASFCDGVVIAGTISALSDCKIKAHGRNIRNVCITMGGAERCDFDVNFDSFVTGGGGNFIGLWFRDVNSVGGLFQRNCRYKLRAGRGTLGNYAIQYTAGSSPISFIGDNKIESDSVFTDWPDFLRVTGNAGQYLNIDGKIQGLTVNNGAPGNGIWKQGTFVYCGNPSSTNKLLGYYRITTGSGNVVGTDWGSVSFV